MKGIFNTITDEDRPYQVCTHVSIKDRKKLEKLCLLKNTCISSILYEGIQQIFKRIELEELNKLKKKRGGYV